MHPEHEQRMRRLPAELARVDPEWMRALFETVEELGTPMRLEEVFARLAKRLRPLVGFDCFGIALLDSEGRDLRFHYSEGYPPQVAEHWRFGMGQGIIGCTAESGRPIRLDHARDDPRYLNGLDTTRSELAVPLIAKGRTIGVIDLQSNRPAQFTEEHEQYVGFIADRLAHAIESARLYEYLRDQARSLSLLSELGRELTSILELKPLLHRVAELVKRLIDYDLFSVMLWNEETQELDHAVSLKFGAGFTQKTGFPLGYGICGTVASTRMPLRVPNVHLEPRYVSCGHDADVRSELVAPLTFKDRLIGVIDLESLEYNAFSEQDEQMLATLASYIAIAIENARLYERVRQDEARLAEDLDTAREIQKGLLPNKVPAIEGLDVGFTYAPARQLGGDFYDFLPYGDGRLAVVAGDAAGKAAAAALHGALAIGVTREHVVSHRCPPREMLAHLNDNLQGTLGDNRFVAMSFAVYDPAGRSLTVANAGFPRPLLFRDGQGEPLAVGGVPLGMLPDRSYGELRLELRPGDVVVFASDGVDDCLGDGDELRVRRMHAMVLELGAESAQAVADGLRRLTDDSGGHLPADDRTIVVLRVI